ncbi:phage integrase SAM-like domain-containing protein [Bacteroides sp. 519]|uniref:phage integrase SAM-like domain-containing protein n=1 Tax=Bacteroides sp. 519 TaxID=2302937 RepID=UPI0013D753C3|nr:phage integrase SAM-like domain-containing protein [Bacteroides sp. 519]NDV58311.1 hypothetical protein [Bacteroides sp. 519]
MAFYHLISLGLTHNTIVFYISRIRSVYNKAVKAKLVKLQDELFDHLYTRSVSTAKRALSHETISLISEGDLSEHANLEFARDMFMLSFYLQGISFVDLAHLRKTDVYS